MNATLSNSLWLRRLKITVFGAEESLQFASAFSLCLIILYLAVPSIIISSEQLDQTATSLAYQLRLFGAAAVCVIYAIIRSGLSINIGSDARMMALQCQFGAILLTSSFAIINPAFQPAWFQLIFIFLIFVYRLISYSEFFIFGIALTLMVLLASLHGDQVFLPTALVSGSVLLIGTICLTYFGKMKQRAASQEKVIDFGFEEVGLDRDSGVFNQSYAHRLLEQEAAFHRRSREMFLLGLIDFPDMEAWLISAKQSEVLARLLAEPPWAGCVARWSSSKLLLMLPQVEISQADKIANELKKGIQSAVKQSGFVDFADKINIQVSVQSPDSELQTTLDALLGAHSVQFKN